MQAGNEGQTASPTALRIQRTRRVPPSVDSDGWDGQKSASPSPGKRRQVRVRLTLARYYKAEETTLLRFPLTVPALLLSLSAAALAQSATRPASTTMHHRRHSVHRVVPHAAARCAPLPAAPVLPPGVPAAAGKVETAFALRYVDITPGTGAPMQPGDFLTVNYTGWLASTGFKFDSSLDRNTPFTFRQGAHRVIAGWDEGLNGMRVGGKRRLFIPWQLAYGEAGRGPIPPQADLLFDVQLLAASPEPPEMPPPAPVAPPQSTPQAKPMPQR
jgi:peptidylprolyl isomerase